MNNLAIPKGKTEAQIAKKCDERLRHLANHSVERGLLMHIMKSPAKTGRPMFQYIEGMTDERTTFADYVQSIHRLSRTQAKDDIRNAIVWACINGVIELSGLDTVAEISATVPPVPAHLREVVRLTKFKTDKVPDAAGQNNTMPVGVENPMLIKEAWEHIQESFEADLDNVAEDEDPPKLNTTYIREKLKTGKFYHRAEVKLPVTNKPKGRIGKLCAAATALTKILDKFKDYENGIQDVITKDGWNATQCSGTRDRLEYCREAIDVTLAEL